MQKTSVLILNVSIAKWYYNNIGGYEHEQEKICQRSAVRWLNISLSWHLLISGLKYRKQAAASKLKSSGHARKRKIDPEALRRAVEEKADAYLRELQDVQHF
jgi:hypothetical protein